jgi:esterase/lipase
MRKQPIEFKVKGEILRGNLYIPKIKLPPAVIIFHGSGGTGDSQIPLAENLAKKGILSFHFNFRGCGRSEGNFLEQTIGDALLDARAAFNLLLELEVNKERIGICGSSFGGNIATLILPEFSVKSLVLKAPAALNLSSDSKIDMGGLEEEVRYFSNRRNWENAVNFENIKKFKGDLLIIKSGKDENVPSEMVDMFYSQAINAKKSMEVIEGADHRLSKQEWINEFTELGLSWFMNTL